MDTFCHRRRILRAVEWAIPRLQGRLLDVGCGQMPYRRLIVSAGRVSQYIGLDIPSERYCPGHLAWDGSRIPLCDASVDCAMAIEVLEHCPDPSMTLAEIVRVLRPGGAFFFTVPFLWPLHDSPNDHYRYTPYALERLLRQAGLEDIESEPMGGWDASLAQVLGLWARRRRWRRSIYRRLASLIVLPLVAVLDRIDRDYTAPGQFHDQLLPTGIRGVARKPADDDGTSQ